MQDERIILDQEQTRKKVLALAKIKFDDIIYMNSGALSRLIDQKEDVKSSIDSLLGNELRRLKKRKEKLVQSEASFDIFLKNIEKSKKDACFGTFVFDAPIDMEMKKPCSLCLENFNKNESVCRVHKCGHVYHRGCMDSYFASLKDRPPACPCCRTKM